MAHDGDAGLDHAPDGRDASTAALEFYRVSAGFLQNAAGVANGLVIIDLIAEEGHIDNHQGPIGSAGNHTAVVDHLVEGDGQAIGQALNHHSQRIAHQKAVDTCLVEEQGGGVVVGGGGGGVSAGGDGGVAEGVGVAE